VKNLNLSLDLNKGSKLKSLTSFLTIIQFVSCRNSGFNIISVKCVASKFRNENFARGILHIIKVMNISRGVKSCGWCCDKIWYEGNVWYRIFVPQRPASMLTPQWDKSKWICSRSYIHTKHYNRDEYSRWDLTWENLKWN